MSALICCQRTSAVHGHTRSGAGHEWSSGNPYLFWSKSVLRGVVVTALKELSVHVPPCFNGQGRPLMLPPCPMALSLAAAVLSPWFLS